MKIQDLTKEQKSELLSFLLEMIGYDIEHLSECFIYLEDHEYTSLHHIKKMSSNKLEDLLVNFIAALETNKNKISEII